MTENNDIRILRELAAVYASCAADPVNEEKKRLYRASNDLVLMRPTVLVDEVPWSELNGNGELTLLCEDPDYRAAEEYLRKRLYEWNHFRADRVLAPYYGVQKIIRDTGIGIEVQDKAIHGSFGDISAHEYTNQFRSMEDVEKLKFRKVTYLEAETKALYEKIDAAFGDLLPVKVTGYETGYSLGCKNWDDIVMFMGANDMMYALYDEPEMMHALAERLTDIFLDTIRQFEAQDLFEADQLYVHSTPALSTKLSEDVDPAHVRTKNLWGRSLAQIFAGVSKEMRDEFDIAYQKRAMAPFGLVYYGCCEPLDTMIDIVEKIPNLRKVTCTPWADTRRMADMLGGRYVLSFKPNPANVRDFKASKSAVEAEFRTLFEAIKKNRTPCDIVLKDISTVSGKPENLTMWTDFVMDMVARYEY